MLPAKRDANEVIREDKMRVAGSSRPSIDPVGTCANVPQIPAPVPPDIVNLAPALRPN